LKTIVILFHAPQNFNSFPKVSGPKRRLGQGSEETRVLSRLTSGEGKVEVLVQHEKKKRVNLEK